MKHHAEQCDWHCDQYDFECTCGATRPATVAWAEAEMMAARYRLGLANERLAIAEARYRKMSASCDEHPQGEDPKGLSGEAMPARSGEAGDAQ